MNTIYLTFMDESTSGSFLDSIEINVKFTQFAQFSGEIVTNTPDYSIQIKTLYKQVSNQ